MNQADKVIVTVGAVVVVAIAMVVNHGGSEGPAKSFVASSESSGALHPTSTGPGTKHHYEPESPLPPLPTDPVQVNAILNPDQTITADSTTPDTSVTADTFTAGQGQVNADVNPFVPAQTPDASSPDTAGMGEATPSPYADTSPSLSAPQEDTSAMPNDVSDQELLDRMMSTMNPDQRDEFRETWWTMDGEDRQEWLLYLRYTLGDVARDPSAGSGSN